MAVNVLHATSDLQQTMYHVRQLLAPGGMLLLMEDTAPMRWMDLTFGLTPGWWKYSDEDLRGNYLLLPPSGWRKLLRNSGFAQVETISTEPLTSQPGFSLPHETVIIARDEAELPNSKPKNWLILADTQGTGQQLSEIMRHKGEVCTLVFPGNEYEQVTSTEFRIDPGNPVHFQQVLQTIPTVVGVINLWSLDAPENLSGTDLQETSLISCGSTLHLIQALINQYTEAPGIWLVTRGAQAVNGHHVQMVAQSPLWGMGKVIALEHPELKCVRVDLDPQATGNEVQTLFEEIISSLSAKDIEDQVAFRDETRYIARLVHHRQSQKTLDKLTLRSDRTYLITGGLGGLGLLIARFLVERGVKHLVLLGRSKVKPAIANQIKQLEQTGARLTVVQADVSNVEQVTQVLADIEQSLPPLRGIIHAAGVLDDGVLLQQNWQRFDRVLAPKVQGAWNLHTLTQNQPLDFFVLFSSTASLLGNAGQGNHAAANAFLDALASYRRMQGLPSLSINWGAWAEVGATARLGLVEQLSRKGEGSIAPQQGLQVLEQLLLNPPVQVGVMPVNWSLYLEGESANLQFFADLGMEIPGLRHQLREGVQEESKGKSLRDTLMYTTAAERTLLLETCITELVAKILGFPASKLDIAESVTKLGLDSLMAIELRSRLNNETGVNLPVMKIMQGPSISQLAEFVLEELAAKIVLDAALSTELAEDMEEIAL
ncbi:SDR family NAD(P)-dependent oxidoreductase [Nostoc sp. 'Peltigera membranacea cyanobiont' 232]|uniref:SDR family NAD(P)-dependent oxidoreductase n=1 Tax=Nostoc sp. 'Peltigera membranacea cyanobiont' 232 TaxID=2014531 RepID=UPI001CB8D0D9|nr:SDR family NAD(P)-dependent oxidoreductase [Nostoc sp. 'Peltigera membranacea cyanobiont' 232]